MSSIGKWFGNEGGNKERMKGEEMAQKYRKIGLDQYTSTLNGALSDSLAYVEPDYQRGQEYNGLLGNYLGLNGLDAQQGAYDDYVQGPQWDFELNNRIDALDRSAASRGQMFSGRQMNAVADEGQNFQRSSLNDYLNRLTQQAGQGQQAGQFAANLNYNTGQNIANAKHGHWQQNAMGQNNLYNQLASTRGSGTQGMLNFAGTALSTLAGMPPIGGFSGGSA